MNSISLSSIFKASVYWSKLTVVRGQLLFSILVIWGISVWLRNEYGQDDSNLWLVMNQFIRLVQWTIAGLFVLSLFTVIATWAYFLLKVKSKTVTIQAKFGDGQKAEAGLVPFSIMISGLVLRPLLGTIQARILFTEKRISNRVILDTNMPTPRHWWRQAIKGTGQTLLNDRGIYDTEKILVSFCDMLGLVSLPCTVPYSQQLYTLPRQEKNQRVKAQPNSTEEQKHRIEIPKHVEGEHVNYKEFESGDNIQRIVWKIYAKSGQLVVRVPETKDPYASHLYLYSSFFHGFKMQHGSFETELLNVYKDRVRNIFEALQHNGYDVRIPQDQEVPKLSGLSETKNELFQITAASWQDDNRPASFVKVNKAAFVCLSSLTPVGEVETLLLNLPDAIPLVVVKLSEAIPSPFEISWKEILFKPDSQPSDKLRQPWLISSLRKEILKNEKEISNVLKQRSNSWLTNRIELDR